MNSLARTTNSKVTIKVFEPRFKDAVCTLVLGIQRGEFEIPVTLDQQPDLVDIPHHYQIGKGNFWTALDGEKVVGTVGLLDIGNNQVALRKMFVAPDYRGPETRTAHLLLDASLAWCAQSSIKTIYLGTTVKYVGAHRFYEKRGFIEIADAALPVSFPRMAVDTKFYMFSF